MQALREIARARSSGVDKFQRMKAHLGAYPMDRQIQMLKKMLRVSAYTFEGFSDRSLRNNLLSVLSYEKRCFRPEAIRAVQEEGWCKIETRALFEKMRLEEKEQTDHLFWAIVMPHLFLTLSLRLGVDRDGVKELYPGVPDEIVRSTVFSRLKLLRELNFAVDAFASCEKINEKLAALHRRCSDDARQFQSRRLRAGQPEKFHRHLLLFPAPLEAADPLECFVDLVRLKLFSAEVVYEMESAIDEPRPAKKLRFFKL